MDSIVPLTVRIDRNGNGFAQYKEILASGWGPQAKDLPEPDRMLHVAFL